MAADTPRLWHEQTVPVTPEVPRGLDIFMHLADQLSPAVVNISTVQKPAKRGERPFGGPRSPFQEREPFKSDPFREFFERFFGETPPQGRQSLGSGFIINPQGLILTNNHVIEEADRIKVILHDEREFEAQVIGRDPKTDLALIKVQTEVSLPTVPLGNSDALRIGEWVMAIGNPFGLSHTVTAGIVSAKGRAIGAGQYDDFIQTDASINPGNSGGPLFNTRGEVVGINTAIIAGGTGIGFAIPVNLAKELLPQLHAKGKVTRGWLGVMIQKVTPDLAHSFNLPQPTGALVADVIADGPAAKGGLQRGDIITKFDGTAIHDMHELPRLVANTPVGKQVKVDLLRQGQQQTVTVTVAELKEETVAASSESPAQLGMEVQDVTPELAQSMGLQTTEGVLVAGVEDDGPAADAGIRRGDVIIEVNRQRVRNTRDYTEALRKNADAAILLLISRGETTLYVALKQ
ncbi:MAG TPA: DegQ family serine endoprotease [Candidatus Tectomicrobia bacterium]|jgi:serine protease Do